MTSSMSDKIKKLSKSEQRILFEKLEIYENLMHFWAVVDETISAYNSKKYEFALAEWLEFLDADHGSLRGYTKWKKTKLIDILEFKEYLYTLKARGDKRCESTVQARLQVIKRISIRLFNFGLISINPWLDLKIKINYERPYKAPMLSVEQVDQLFKSLMCPKSIRNRAIFACLAGGGLRLSEVLNLKCQHVQRTKKGRVYIKLVNTKNGNTYLQPLPKNLGEFVMQWKEEARKYVDEDYHLFFKRFKTRHEVRPLKRSAVRKIIQRKFDELNFPFSTTHSFRVTAITQLIQNKVPLQDVQKFARHESIRTTVLYNRDVNMLEEETLDILDF
jgi:integrase/recombinase XerC